MKDTISNEEEIKDVIEEQSTVENSVELYLKEEDKLVKKVDHETLSINGDTYKIVENYRDGLDLEMLEARYSDFLEKYDYIVGDISYEKLRLRGFYYSKNKKVPIDMRISSLKDYLTEYCNFGCAYFVLERMEPKRKQKSQPKRKGKPSTNKKINQSTKQTQHKKVDQTKKQEGKANSKKREPLKKDQSKKAFTKKDRQQTSNTANAQPKTEENKVKTVKNQKGETKFKIRQKNKTDAQ
ncbi:YutD family protein [Marinilactibacillus sp. Marseille-P9653]|uniref:YutD family protein n=1 Tax=Marinilactibacillus sp. Marseille-P9653 TaxID=2866583 RepID=UPI001CE3FF58|nr:YutD family protein [Marinilactibacillus sp. Marseille-P9653]